jgi:hypothetical protein
MGVRDDYMAMRLAAHRFTQSAALSRVDRAVGALLKRASADETRFIRLRHGGVLAETIDLAYAVLGEERPGGPAVQEEQET